MVPQVPKEKEERLVLQAPKEQKEIKATQEQLVLRGLSG
jgi:hypothetical protein